MSMFYRANMLNGLVPEECCRVKVYDDGRTKQAFKDETDINRILAKFQQSGVVSHLAKFEPQYGEFENFDFMGNALMLDKAEEIFAALPSEVRREFDQDLTKFFDFVNDDEHKGKLAQLMPEIAEASDYFPDVSSSADVLVNGGEPGGRGRRAGEDSASGSDGRNAEVHSKESV